MADAVAALQLAVTQDRGAGPGKGVTPLLSDARSLHTTITRLEGHLVQLKTLTQHRSK